MKKYIAFCSIILLLCSCQHTVNEPKYADYPIRQVNLTQVELTDNFWLPKIRTVQQKTIRYAFEKCREEGRFDNFVTAGKVIAGGEGVVRGEMPFDDTDVYKTIEGAAYSLISHPDAALEQYVDSVIGLVAQGQEPDGYLTTWRTINPMKPPCDWVRGGPRWDDLQSSHELYNAGHLYEAASAHFRATGKRNFLDIALKNADLLVKVFGDSSNYLVPGHQIVETGLIKLYQITDNEDYLHLSKKFLDQRGDSIHRKLYGEYNQDHLPVTQQNEVTGHAVRAVYMYAGMTDIAAIYNDQAYNDAVFRLWDNMITKKMYVTGGLGARHSGESFGDNYELPNLTAYSETCAAIGGVYWGDRLFRLTGDAQYYDIVERILYNALLAGISLSGTEFFYPNPLEANGIYKFNQGALTRMPWFNCSCCPTNLIRFLPYIPNLIYATEDNTVYINLFIANKSAIPLADETVEIVQTTEYPVNGDVQIRVKSVNPQLKLKIRIPGWYYGNIPGSLYKYNVDNDDINRTNTGAFSVNFNDELIELERKNGYIEIGGKWTGDDIISLKMPMHLKEITANELVADDAGKVALEYGPLIYCAEEIDNPQIDNAKYSVPVIYGIEKEVEWGAVNVIRDGNLTYVPYYAWSNRGAGKMKVWFPKDNSN